MSGVLVDSSVWRRFFTGRDAAAIAPALRALLDGLEDALTPGPSSVSSCWAALRQEGLFDKLRPAPSVGDEEVMSFIKRHRLMRRGIGWVDVQLLASAAVGGALLWSVDKNLASVAARLNLAFESGSNGKPPPLE
jgi:hypothetical protein